MSTLILSNYPILGCVKRPSKEEGGNESESNVVDVFGENFDRYVKIQENKTENFSRMEREIVETKLYL